jgi:hypothetical protein
MHRRTEENWQPMTAVILLILGERSPPDRHARKITRTLRVVVMAVDHAHHQASSKIGRRSETHAYR